VERNPAVVFCHDDMEFARGEPERRRFFFDQTAGLVSAGYIDLLRSYRAPSRPERRAQGRSLAVLDVLDIQLAATALALARSASRAPANSTRFAPRYEEGRSRLGTRVGVAYRPSWRLDEDPRSDVVKRLAAARDRELALGTSLSGPHRDRFVFIDERGDFSTRASTGQLRLLA
jgi:DNA replication and repair protein RecF